MKKILVGSSIFAAGMLSHKKLVKELSNGLAKEREKDGCASMHSSYDELKQEHPKLHKVARCVANVVMFFV